MGEPEKEGEAPVDEEENEGEEVDTEEDRMIMQLTPMREDREKLTELRDAVKEEKKAKVWEDSAKELMETLDECDRERGPEDNEMQQGPGTDLTMRAIAARRRRRRARDRDALLLAVALPLLLPPGLQMIIRGT